MMASPRPRRVVVGVAGHAGTVRTLAWAIAEAVATRAQLVVVHATGRPRDERAGTAAAGRLGARGSIGVLETVDRSAAGAVAAARSRLGEASVRIIVEADVPGDVLCREAGPTDVLVIGGPPRSGWWVRSGTTNYVVPRARCPVIVVHEPYGSFSPPPDPPSDIAVALRGQVVVGLDGCGASEATLGYGFGYADSHNLALVVAQVVPSADPGTPVEAGLSMTRELDAELELWHQKYPEVPIQRLVLAGRPDEELRRACAEAALLVIGAGGTALHPLGVTCRSLVETAGCPVAVLH